MIKKNFQFSIFNFQLFCLALLLGVFVMASYAKAFEVKVDQAVALDPRFTLNPLNVDMQWGLAAANFPAAWEKTIGSTSTIVAIVDTGIDANHEDLKNQNFTEGFDFVNNKTIPIKTDSDDNGHGTLVASIIGATANNGKGIAGANWRVSLMPLKALDNLGRGESGDVAKAIVWAADHKANVINLSFGGSGFEHEAELSKAIAYAFNQGAVIVASAGNDDAKGSKDLDKNPVFPVCDDNNQNMVIGVTALDQNNVKPDFANYGKNCIDVSAPGRRILAAVNIDPVSKSVTESGYIYVSGTSFAAAYVSAEAALIKSYFPDAFGSQIRDRIIATARNVDNINIANCGGVSCGGKIGAGLIDAATALSKDFPLPSLSDGDLVRGEGQTQVFLIAGGQKRPVSPMVFNQRFLNQTVKFVSAGALSKIPTGPYATPKEGTLVKSLNNPTVYQVQGGFKLPITGQIFSQRGFNFSDVQIADSMELDTWVTGKFLAPKEGTLVKMPYYPDLYWTIGGIFHKVSREFYQSRGLKIFPILTVTKKDFFGYNIGEAYLR